MARVDALLRDELACATRIPGPRLELGENRLWTRTTTVALH
jgi:hypothetical protein